MIKLRADFSCANSAVSRFPNQLRSGFSLTYTEKKYKYKEES
jgi:hypothetical protein